MTPPRSHVHIMKPFWFNGIAVELFTPEDRRAVIIWPDEQHMVFTSINDAPLTCAHSHPVAFFYDNGNAVLTRNTLKSLWIHNLP